MTKKIIEVVGAAIIKEDKVLAMQRSEQMTLPGMWEFPGGKVEADETEQHSFSDKIVEKI